MGSLPRPVKKSSDTKDTKDPRKIKCINLTAKRAKAAKRNKYERHGKILEERVDSRITAFRNRQDAKGHSNSMVQLRTDRRAKAIDRTGHTGSVRRTLQNSVACPINSRSSWIPQEHSLLNTLIPRQVDETKIGSDHVNQHFCL